MIEVRPKIDPILKEINKEDMMLFFAKCIKNYCFNTNCRECPFYDEVVCCKLSGTTPTEWSVQNE